MKRKIIVVIAGVLVLGVAAYVISEQKMPEVSAASTPESTSVAAPASEANIVQGETNSEENNVDAGAQAVTGTPAYDERGTTTIQSGPNKGQEFYIPSQKEWDGMSTAEREAYYQQQDPVGYEASMHAGETPESYRERQKSYTTQEQKDAMDAALGF